MRAIAHTIGTGVAKGALLVIVTYLGVIGVNASLGWDAAIVSAEVRVVAIGRRAGHTCAGGTGVVRSTCIAVAA